MVSTKADLASKSNSGGKFESSVSDKKCAQSRTEKEDDRGGGGQSKSPPGMVTEQKHLQFVRIENITEKTA